MIMRFVITAICILIAASVGLLTYGWYYERSQEKPYGVPFSLVTAAGAEVTQEAFRGHPTAVFFGYTNCEDVCPATLYEIGEWLKDLGQSGQDIHIWFVTVDPERDRPEVLKSYLSNFSPRIRGMTGEPEKVRQMLRGFSIYFAKVAPEHAHGEDTHRSHSAPEAVSASDTKNYGMAHTSNVLLLDSRGHLVGTINYKEPAKSAEKKLRLLAQQ
jgi:protein SCO1/2